MKAVCDVTYWLTFLEDNEMLGFNIMFGLTLITLVWGMVFMYNSESKTGKYNLTQRWKQLMQNKPKGNALMWIQLASVCQRYLMEDKYIKEFEQTWYPVTN